MTRLIALSLALAPFAASAETYLEIGGRLELLDIDQPLHFTCDEPCDTEADPDCAAVLPPDQLCRDAWLDTPHEGWMLGGLVGLHFGPATGTAGVSAGVRLVGAFGAFEPRSRRGAPAAGARADPEAVTLAHVTLELPLEVRLGAEATHVYLQAVPRLGVLNYIDGRDEEADTFTAGILLVAGLRFGVGEGSLGAAVGRVQHSSFGGRFGEVTWRAPAGGSLGVD